MNNQGVNEAQCADLPPLQDVTNQGVGHEHDNAHQGVESMHDTMNVPQYVESQSSDHALVKAKILMLTSKILRIMVT
jgi:hypothetical protein